MFCLKSSRDRKRQDRALHEWIKIITEKDLALCELPSHAKALDKALKAKWVREQMNIDPKTGEKRRIQQKNRQEKKKGKWTDRKD